MTFFRNKISIFVTIISSGMIGAMIHSSLSKDDYKHGYEEGRKLNLLYCSDRNIKSRRLIKQNKYDKYSYNHYNLYDKYSYNNDEYY